MLGAALASSVILALILFADGNFGDRNDFPSELWPAYRALYGGHVIGFIRLSPAYVLAAIWRAPLAMVAMAAGAGWRLTYFVTAVPCFAAMPWFAVWFARRMGAGDAARRRTVLTLVGVAVLDPIAWYAGILGHPEEFVGTAFALASVVCAAEGRWRPAVVLFVLAVFDKPGIAELAPVVLVAVPGRLTRPLLVAGLVVAVICLVIPLNSLLSHLPFGHEDLTSVGRGYPFDLLWWFGANSWPIRNAHVLTVLVAVAVCLAWHLRDDVRSPGAGERVGSLLWLAALTLLIRTALDPGDNTYYNLPVVLCLACLESQPWIASGGLTGRWPVITVGASAAILIVVPFNRILPVGPTVQAVLFTVAALAAVASLGWQIRRSVSPAHPGAQP